MLRILINYLGVPAQKRQRRRALRYNLFVKEHKKDFRLHPSREAYFSNIGVYASDITVNVALGIEAFV